MDRPIPAFYCVYLLRSTRSKISLYTGSTPNPRRRLKQHNGDIIGGANRTSRVKLRPWKMVILVTGFPSKIAALQFEWAWQNPHRTRHLRNDEPESEDLLKFMQAFPMKRPKQGPGSLSGKLLSLISLLSTQSFNRWPLQIDLFDPDAVDIWQRQVKKSAPDITSRISICVHADARPVAPNNSKSAMKDEIASSHGAGENSGKQPGIDGLDVSFQPYKAHVQKSLEALSQDPAPCCTLCDRALHHDTSFALTCSAPSCSMVVHVGCLAENFLREEPIQDAIVPVRGACPKCRTTLRWAELTRELTLRIRGKADLERLFRKPQNRAKGDSKAKHTRGACESNSEENEEQYTDEKDGRNETRSGCVVNQEAPNSARKFIPSVIIDSSYEDINELSE